MTMPKTLLTIILLAVVFSSHLLAAELYRIEFASNFGSTDNLVDDSSNLSDAYSTSTLRLLYYPFTAIEINLGGQQSYYRDRPGLSSITGQLGFTLIPTQRTSPFSLYISCHFNGIRYHSDFNGFDNNVGKLEISAGYEITPTISIRGGFSHSSTSYISLDIDKKKDIEYFWGGNITLPGSIGFDIESGFARASYRNVYADTTVFPLYNIFPPDSLPARLSEELWVFYWSPRVSRIVAPKTGLNIVFTKRNFQNYGQQVVFGFSTSFLSPWASVWEGQSITTGVKSFIIPRLILTAGAGYWDKTFLKTVEEEHVYYINLLQDLNNRRHDYQTRYYGSVQWPIANRSGLLVEPSIRVDYTKNISTADLYMYSDYTFSAMVTVRL